VSRPRLVERLNRGLTGKLTLISAPAGSGKTSLLSEWIPCSQQRVTWLSLDKGDNDPTCFWGYFIGALQLLQTGLGESALGLLQSPQPPPPELILTTLLNELAAFPHAFALVLDDYHVIESPAIHQALTFMLDHLPPQMHLMMTSRVDPPLPLSRLRSRDQLTELRARDLRFTLDEVTTFFNQVMGLALSTADVAALEARTEGWIAGLQLAALSMQGRNDLPNFVAAFTGSHRFILDYLTDEVLERRPKGTRNFLLQTSILGRLCGPLCNAVTGGSDSQATLERLEQANLFLIPLDDDRHWYRYHHLFAEMLQARLRQSEPELLPDLHRRASDWYAAHDSVAEAIQHALAASDVVRAAGLIERERWILLGRGEINTVRTWLDELPAEIVRARPRLSLAYAWIFSLLEQAEAIEPHLQDTERALAATEISEQPAEVDALQGEIATLRIETALNRSDMPGAIELCRYALKLLPEDNALVRGIATIYLGYAQRYNGQMAEAERAYVEASRLGVQADNLLLASHALANLSILQVVMGRLGAAAETSQRILQLTAERQRQDWPVAGLAYQGLGKVYYERNDLEAAEHHSRLGIEFGRRGSLIGLELNSRSTLAFTLQAQHDPDGADEMLRQIATMNERHHHLVHKAVAAASEARLRLRQGRTEQAGRWAETCGLRPDDSAWPYRLEVGYLTLARVFIAQGQAGAVLDLLHRLQQAAEADKRTGSLIEILILCALARQAQGDANGALTALEQALALAEPEGYIRIFVDEGAPMAALLRKALSHGVRPGYVDKLLITFEAEEPGSKEAEQRQGAPVIPRPPTPLLLEPLTERELELLRLVAAGRSNQEIAQELFLAVGTVKKHLNNIFGKLNVGSRTQAIVRARELELL
jgi:LuxR family maltose regulon positive regulatory protein